MKPASLTTSPLPVDTNDPPDLTETLRQCTKTIVGTGSFGTVWHCSCPQNMEVAVKAIIFRPSFDPADKPVFLRKMRRELGIWRRLDHHNIVPLLGITYSRDFGSEHPCMVSVWMPHGTLAQYINQNETMPSLPSRIRLVKGTAAGLEYLHSKSIVHGDFHPGNILIDSDHNPRITDFGLSQTLTRQDHLTYLCTDSIRPGAAIWVAPELRYPHLFPDLKFEATLSSDIYSLGSIILYILSGKLPRKKAEPESSLEELESPPRPPWPVLPDIVWDLIEQCWSPRSPRNRPSAQFILSFSRDRLEQLLQPDPASDINVVLFGALGCGKSSIVNLLFEKPIAPVSPNVEPCTKRPRCYRIPIGERQFRLWDTMGFRLPYGGAISPLSPYEQAHAVLRDLPDGVHLILLCAQKDEINASLRGLYWLINNFFFDGRAPIAFVVTHFNPLDNSKEWWERNRRDIVNITGIPVQCIPHACIATNWTGCDQSRQRLKSLLENYATPAIPTPLRLDLSSYITASHDIASRCNLDIAEATALVDKFSRPRNKLNVVLFGKAGAGKSSIINLIAGRPIAKVSSDIEICTLDSGSYTIDSPTRQFLIWDTVGFNGIREGRDLSRHPVMEAVQLVRKLTAKSGIDLLIFVKGCGKLTASELNCYRLFEGFLCKGQVPVAVVVTHLEDHEVMEQWWEMNGEDLKALRGNVIGHACITSLASHNLEDSKIKDKLSDSILAVQALFESYFSFLKGEGVSVQLRAQEGGEIDRVPEEMTVENLVNQCGLTRELAREVIKLYDSK